MFYKLYWYICNMLNYLEKYKNIKWWNIPFKLRFKTQYWLNIHSNYYAGEFYFKEKIEKQSGQKNFKYCENI